MSSLRIDNYTLTKNRIVFYDYLRIFATLSVVILHVSASNWSSTEVNNSDWMIMNIFDGLQRWNVPIFVMISGSLFLGRPISIKKIYFRNIPKIVISFITWSLFFSLWKVLTEDEFSVSSFLHEILFGHYHLWFLFTIAGLYITVPFFNIIVKDDRMAVIFLAFSFVFQFLFSELPDLSALLIPKLQTPINEYLQKIQVPFFLGYSGYFVLGYFLYQLKIGRKIEIIIYGFGILGLIITIGGTSLLSIMAQVPLDFMYKNLSINTLMVALAVFTFFKQHFNKSVKSNRVQERLVFLSKCTFGIYLIHPFFIELLNKIAHLNTLSFSPVISIPILSVVVFLASLIVSALLNKIPVINKWIV